MDFIDINSLVLGVLSVCLFAECIILVVRVNSLRNKMDADVQKARADERVKFEKKRSELELALKEKELELKGEYEDLLAAARSAKRESEEKLAEVKAELKVVQSASESAKTERERFEFARSNYEAQARAYAEKLASIAGVELTEILSSAKDEIKIACARELENYRGEILSRSMRDIDSSAKRVLLDTMQRLSTSIPASATCAVVAIPDDAIKGRLIGRDGRNIRSFESETATTLVIDDSPNSVMVSSFNPTRRAIAKLALEELVADGRISPSTIELAVAKAKESLERKVYDIGYELAESLNLARVHPDVLSALGRLSFHLSLNQNTLQHSEETAKLAGMIASELELDASIARRAGLFHDIGKAMADSDLSHAKAGAELLRRSGESDLVVNAVEAHHNEVADTSFYSAIIRLADSISATREGARMEALDGFIKRVRTLENLATSFEGVSGAYVLQAGRELRVMVAPDALDDAQACALSSRICLAIEEKSGGSIPVKVTVIREARFSKTANARD